MKKQLSLFGWAVATFGMGVLLSAPASFAASNSAEYNVYGPSSVDTVVTTVEYGQYRTNTSARSYDSGYTQRHSDMYRNYTGCKANKCGSTAATIVKPVEKKEIVSTRNKSEIVKTSSVKKDYMADPFYQPKQGGFGSVTEVGYTINTYDFHIADSLLENPGGDPVYDGKWDLSALYVKEDASVGITDDFAFMASAQYVDSKYKINWDDSTVDDDEMNDSSIEMLGIGLLWKFADTNDWIADISGYYQWREISNTFIVDLKAGYKVDDMVLYGLARGYYMKYDNNAYGNGIDTGSSAIFFAMSTDAETTTSFEVGFGMFTPFVQDWTLNLEAIIGDYDWHQQGSILASIGWQPSQHFGLSLFGKTAFYDSANSKENIGVYYWDTLNPIPTNVGTIGISKYVDMSFGIRAMVQF